MLKQVVYFFYYATECFSFYMKVKFDEDRRYPRMEHILQAVRCQYLTPSFLKEQMSTCSVLQKVPACREYLAKIFKVIINTLNYFLTLQRWKTSARSAFGYHSLWTTAIPGRVFPTLSLSLPKSSGLSWI